MLFVVILILARSKSKQMPDTGQVKVGEIIIPVKDAYFSNTGQLINSTKYIERQKCMLKVSIPDTSHTSLK